LATLGQRSLKVLMREPWVKTDREDARSIAQLMRR
jgi:hypothetical protein